jgi:aconitate hydratase 2/2-methylisocitrate dehydratase
MVMQSFCHTAPYPKPVDVLTHRELPPFITHRGGVSLKVGDGVIHSWLNRLLLPDTVGTGGDSHTRFPIGISFPAGSGLVAFAAATGVMPLDMPESVLVRFKGKLNPGITLRDLVNAIPYYAIKQGLLTVEKKGKKNLFSGRILEIEGLPDLKVEQAFELTDASAERSAAGCSVRLNKEPVVEYLRSNITLMKWMIAEGYEDKRTLARRINAMEEWIAKGALLQPDADAEYAAVIDIDLADVREPILACPNDPDDVKLLSEVAGDKIDEVFIGSCTNGRIEDLAIVAGLLAGRQVHPDTRTIIVPGSRQTYLQALERGYIDTFLRSGAVVMNAGCGPCLGRQHGTLGPGERALSTSNRNYPGRMGSPEAEIYLANPAVAAVSALAGAITDPRGMN